MTRFLVVMLCIFPSTALAGRTTLTIPDQHWQISFDSPRLEKLDESNHPKQYKYVGSSGRLALSVFVESPGCRGGTTHEAFYECFWPKASRNPFIIKDSVTKSCVKNYCKVTYDVEALLKDGLVRQRNINFLIAYRGKWTDLHVSIINPTKADLKLLDRLANSLSYRESK